MTETIKQEGEIKKDDDKDKVEIAKTGWEKIDDAIFDPIMGDYRQRAPFVTGALTGIGVFAGMRGIEGLVNNFFDRFEEELEPNSEFRTSLANQIEVGLETSGATKMEIHKYGEETDEEFGFNFLDPEDQPPPFQDVLENFGSPITDADEIFSTGAEIGIPIITGGIVAGLTYLLGTRIFKGKRATPKN